jgi:hypothetical protein
MGNISSHADLSPDKIHKTLSRQSHTMTAHIKKKRSFRNDSGVHSVSSSKSQTSLPPSPTLSETMRENDSMVINGRRYQNVTKKYMLPNDEEEQDRLVQEVCIPFYFSIKFF